MASEKILSVGIDLGTSTTQLVLSELTIENFASAFSVPRITISDKKVIYRSDVIFTPLLNETEIADEPIKKFVLAQYDKLDINKDDIQMGAVIITGETARKKNANRVLQALSGYAGDFVVATAGPDLESIIAGKGAGAQTYSEQNGNTIVNIDVGGGTSNFAVFKNGEVIDAACFDIGGRLIKVDSETQKVSYIAPKVQELIKEINCSIELGVKVTPEILDPIITILTTTLENSIGIGDKNQFYEQLITNHDLQENHEIRAITFSGGVADCFSEQLPSNPFKYGDIGLLLGNKLYQSQIFSQKKVMKSEETIGATVVGAGSHTTEVSGSTISYTDKVLPIKNVPILKLSNDDELLGKQELGDRIVDKLNWYYLEDGLSQIALAIKGLKSPNFMDIERYAAGFVSGLQPLIDKQMPLIIMVDADMAKALGHSLFAKLPKQYPFVCIDSVKVENGDYIDIGLPIANGTALPVIVKTLVFN